MVSDARYRVKLALDTYILAANMFRQDAVTALQYHVMFDDGIIPLKKMMAGSGASEKNLDVLYSIGQPTSNPVWNFEHPTAYYIENVPVTIYAVDPINRIEGTKTLWTAQAEFRRIMETYWGGSLGVLRRITSEQPNTVDMGGWKLYSIKNTVEYERWNSNYLPTYPAFSDHPIYTYQGDRLSGGTEGTWDITGHLGGSTVVIAPNSEKKLDFQVTTYVADAYIHNGTSLGLSTTAYPKIRVRYKIVNDSGTIAFKLSTNNGDITGMTSLTSTTMASVEATLPTGTTNTLNINYLGLTGAKLGHIIIDSIQIYGGNYIIPCCLKIDPPQTLKDSVIKMPGMSGNLTQGLGSDLIEVTMDCYLDMEYYNLDTSTYHTWKRPQTVAPASKTDYNNTDVFTELQQAMGISTAWVWLNLGYPKMQFKARLYDMHPSYSGEKGVVTLVWREYRHGSASSETAVERYGMSL